MVCDVMPKNSMGFGWGIVDGTTIVVETTMGLVSVKGRGAPENILREQEGLRREVEGKLCSTN